MYQKACFKVLRTVVRVEEILSFFHVSPFEFDDLGLFNKVKGKAISCGNTIKRMEEVITLFLKVDIF